MCCGVGSLSASSWPIGRQLADWGARDPARADSSRGDVARPIVGPRVADCAPVGLQLAEKALSACCWLTRLSRPAAGRLDNIFEKYYISVIFLQINKKMYYLKKISSYITLLVRYTP